MLSLDNLNSYIFLHYLLYISWANTILYPTRYNVKIFVDYRYSPSLPFNWNWCYWLSMYMNYEGEYTTLTTVISATTSEKTFLCTEYKLFYIIILPIVVPGLSVIFYVSANARAACIRQDKFIYEPKISFLGLYIKFVFLF